MRESTLPPDERPEPAQATDRGILISVWQDFDEWQFELDCNHPAAPVEIAWEPIA